MDDLANRAATAADTARALHARLGAVRATIADEAARTLALWYPALHREDFVPSAGNLACYLALRRADLRALQEDLVQLGLSSLGRCEAHVRPTLDAVSAALAAIGGLPPEDFPAASSFTTGAERIEARQADLFGPRNAGPHARIMATLPTEAADGPALAQRIVAAGADVLRINCAHDGPEVWAAMIANARAAATATGRGIRIAMDLGGPKVRIAALDTEDKVRLHRGDRFVLARTFGAPEEIAVATLSHPELIDGLTPGARVWIDDGKIGARVVSLGVGRAVLEVTVAAAKGAKLKPEKGVNLPGVDVDIPALTEADLTALDFVAEHADIVGYSFVQTAEDIRALIAALRARRGSRPLPALMLKIETQKAVRALPRLIVEAGGSLPVAVMIARGDLAVEIGLERLSEMQEEILWICEAAQVPVVWATQVLDTLLKDGSASRAETTDAAMGQRAECVMLNKGPFLPEAVAFLHRILTRLDRHQAKKFPLLGPLHSWDD